MECRYLDDGVDRAIGRSVRNERLHTLTRQAAFGTIVFLDRLPTGLAFRRIGGQLFDSATSQASNYRAADRAQSTAGLIAKLKIVEEEADESQFWLECLFVAKLPSALHSDAKVLQDQFAQITAMTVAALRTSRARLAADKAQRKRPTK